MVVVTPGTVAVFVAAVATLLVAGFALFLDFNQRVHRAFALLLLLRGMLDAFLPFTLLASDYAGRLRVYWFIAVPFAALHFALAYRRRHGRAGQRRPGWLAPWAILAACLAFEGLYMLDHSLFGFDASQRGPLIAFVFLPWPIYAGIAWIFARDVEAGAPAHSRQALVLASFGLVLQPLFFALFRNMFLAVSWLRGNAETYTLPLQFAETGAYLFTLVVAADVLRRLFRGLSGQPGRRRALFLVAAADVLSVAAAIAGFVFLPLDTASSILQVIAAVWALALPVLVTRALVKHRLFDAEVKLRFAIKGSTVAAVFLAVFFVVSQMAQNFLSTRGGLVVGGIVTGLVLFAINPLQHFADRLARRAVPGGPARGTHAERVQIYREQLEIAWADGRLTTKERLLFARLQERLGIPADEAARLETEVLSGLAKPVRGATAAKATA